MHRRVHGRLGSKGRAIESNIMTSVKLYYVEPRGIVKATAMITADLNYVEIERSLIASL